jgi:MFS family permease
MMRVPAGKLAPTLALLTSVFVTALNLSSTATALPSIVGELGGLSLYSWTTAAYLLTSTTAAPLYGKLADLYGRKPLFFWGTALFVLGSALCGLATSIEQLILCRALQGLGAAGIFPITLTIAGDLFALEDRAKFAGVQSTVWAVGAVAGPAIASALVSQASWRWVFWVNVPIAVLAALVLAVTFQDRPTVRRHRLDYLGAVLFTAGVAALLYALVEGGQWGFGARHVGGMLVAAALLLAATAWVEAHAPEPVIPLNLVSDRFVGLVNLAGFALGAAMQGHILYLPLFIQGAQGGPPSHIALVSGTMTVFWAVGSLLGSRLVIARGFRAAGLVGMSIVCVGGLLLTRLTLDTPLAAIVAIGVVIAVGMGACSGTFVVATQTAVGREQRGAATGAHQFCRSIGGTIWVSLQGAALGAVMAGTLASAAVAGAEGSGRFGRLTLLLDPAVRASLPPDQARALAELLASGLHLVFLLYLAIALVGLVAVALLPRRALAEQVVAASPS